MTAQGKKNPKVILRALIAITMMVLWSLVIATGLILWLAPEGPRSGQEALLLEMTKQGWKDIHFWVSLIAVMVTTLHVIIDWKAFCGCVKYLASTSRSKATSR